MWISDWIITSFLNLLIMSEITKRHSEIKDITAFFRFFRRRETRTRIVFLLKLSTIKSLTVTTCNMLRIILQMYILKNYVIFSILERVEFYEKSQHSRVSASSIVINKRSGRHAHRGHSILGKGGILRGNRGASTLKIIVLWLRAGNRGGHHAARPLRRVKARIDCSLLSVTRGNAFRAPTHVLPRDFSLRQRWIFSRYHFFPLFFQSQELKEHFKELLLHLPSPFDRSQRLTIRSLFKRREFPCYRRGFDTVS